MQEECYDYYEAEDPGCCLLCDKAEEGCLCYECKCSKCYWYSSPEDYDGEKGHCDLTDTLKIRSRARAWGQHLFISKSNYKKFLKLEKENELILIKIKENKCIPNYYSCQKCGRNFVTEESLKIIFEKEPLCNICKKKIILTDNEIKKIREEVEILVEQKIEEDIKNERG